MTKITFCTDGIDPNVYVERIQNTMPYFGFQIPCGWSDYMGVYIEPGTNTIQWQAAVNSWADHNELVNSVETLIFGICLGVEIPEGKLFSIGGALFGWSLGEFTGAGWGAVRDAMVNPNANSPEWGLNWCLENTYYYYPDGAGFETLGYQHWYVRDWSQQDYPFVQVQGVTTTFGDIILMGGVANAMCIDDVINTFATHYSWNHWYQISYDQMPKILDPPQPIWVSIVGVDDYTGQNLYYESWDCVPVYIDGVEVGYLGYSNIVNAYVDQGYHTIQVGDSYIYGQIWYQDQYGSWQLGHLYATFECFDYLIDYDQSNPSGFTAYNDMTIVAHYDGENWEP